MATILADDFNSYEDGDLNTQGDWSGSVNFDIQGITYEGAKAVRVHTGAEDVIDKLGEAQTDGLISVYLRRDSTSGTGRSDFTICEGSTAKFGYRWDSGNINIWNGSTWVSLKSGYTAEQWYLCDIEWRSSDSKGRYRIDGGTWSDWYDPMSAWSDLDTVRLGPVNTLAVDDYAYYDYIHPLDVTVTPSVITSTFGIQAPVVSIGTTVFAAVVATTFSIHSPTITGGIGNTITPSVLTATFSVIDPAILIPWAIRTEPSIVHTERTEPDADIWTERTEPSAPTHTKRVKPW